MDTRAPCRWLGFFLLALSNWRIKGWLTREALHRSLVSSLQRGGFKAVQKRNADLFAGTAGFSCPFPGNFCRTPGHVGGGNGETARSKENYTAKAYGPVSRSDGVFHLAQPTSDLPEIYLQAMKCLLLSLSPYCMTFCMCKRDPDFPGSLISKLLVTPQPHKRRTALFNT